VNGILHSFAEAQAAMAKQLVHLERRGPAFTEDGPTPYQRKLESAQAILRSGFELLLEAERGRELTPGERDHCVTEAAIAMRRHDPACYEDDKSDAVGLTVEYFRGRRIAASEEAIREIAQEAVSFYRTVEARS
jgi:hypothetical protein